MKQAASLSSEMLLVFENIPDLYLILSPDFHILTASNAYLKATFKKREEIEGKSVFEVFPDNQTLSNTDAIANLRRSLEWVLQHKQTLQTGIQRYDISHPEQQGTFIEKYWDASISPVLDKEGNFQYFIYKVEDVTEQVISLKELEKREPEPLHATGKQAITRSELVSARTEADLEREKLYNIFMQAPAMICIFEGPQHVFKLVNPSYQQLVGDRPLLGRPIAEAMPELVGQPIFGLLDRVYNKGVRVQAHEMKVQLDHDNTGGLGHNYYNFTYQPIKNLGGTPEGIMVFAYEVTDLVTSRQQAEQREQALQKLNEELESANEEVRAANEEISETQSALRELNQKLEERVTVRTRELQLSKAETEAQRNQLQQLFMQAPAPIVILDGPDLVFELVNPAYQQIFPGRALLGKPLLKALPEVKVSPVPGILNKVYQTGETFVAQELSLMLSRHEGAPPEEIFWTFTYQARRNEVGEVDGVLVFAHDVTDQVRTRQEVERTAEQLKLITDSLPVLIGYLDKEEKYRFANQAYEAWFNQKPEELLGRPVREVVGEKAYQGVKQYIERALAGERLDFESRMPYREDFVKHIRTSYVPDFRNGNVAGFYTLVQDITEQVEARLQIEERQKQAKDLADELKAANEQLIRTNVDLDNFIYAASHDLKAPIFNIEGLMRILVDSLPRQVIETQGLEEVTGMIAVSIERFKRTIDHMTDVTKLQKEHNQEAVVVDLAEVIREVMLDLSSQLEAANAQLDVDVASCSVIRFSEKNLRSVVYNLFSNAIKYASPNRTPKIQIQCQTKGKYDILSISDNGLGMDLRKKNKLFSMFGRLHDHVEGSGVGLYMVKKIVENADGRIEVESKVGVGSTFHVYFRR